MLFYCFLFQFILYFAQLTNKQNRLSFVEDITKHFGLFFSGHICSYVKSCSAIFLTRDAN